MIDSDIRTEDYGRFPSPCYIVEERLLRRNLALISRVARESRTEIILAFKASPYGAPSRSFAST